MSAPIVLPVKITKISAAECWNGTAVHQDVWGLGEDGQVYNWSWNLGGWQIWKA